MGTKLAQKALDDNLKNYVNARTDPVMHNLCVALNDMAKALAQIESKVEHLSNQVAHLASR